jgi:transcription antitermination factor NusG
VYIINVTEGQRSFAMDENNFNWYAVYTKPRWEKKVAKLLDEHAIENYCPLNKVLKQWTDRKKIVLEPIFKSYVFVKISDKKKWELKKIPGVLNFVYWLKKPAIIQEVEIETIKRFLSEFSNVKIENLDMALNSTVVIKQGLMMNYKGILIEVKGNKAKVRIESMGLQLNATFDKNNLELIAV